MKTYWFKRKRYGYGLCPATWQGWMSTTVFVVLAILNVMRFDAVSSSMNDDAPISLIMQTIIMVVIFVAIAYWKGEKPWRWQWGKEDKEK